MNESLSSFSLLPKCTTTETSERARQCLPYWMAERQINANINIYAPNKWRVFVYVCMRYWMWCVEINMKMKYQYTGNIFIYLSRRWVAVSVFLLFQDLVIVSGRRYKVKTKIETNVGKKNMVETLSAFTSHYTHTVTHARQ